MYWSYEKNTLQYQTREVIQHHGTGSEMLVRHPWCILLQKGRLLHFLAKLYEQNLTKFYKIFKEFLLMMYFQTPLTTMYP